MQNLPFTLVATLVAVLATGGWRICSAQFRRFLYKKMTVIYDLPNIGKARADGKRMKGTAVVCGGSIAGLWAARICGDHFEEVVVVEPEAWLASEEGKTPIYDEKGNYIESRGVNTRTRVSQYLGAHVFQPLTLQALRYIFPNFDKEVVKCDGRIVDAEYNLHVDGHHTMRLPKGDYPDGNYPKCFFMSRESYERLLRRLVLESSDRIRWVTGTATGLKTTSGNQSSISSVTVKAVDGSEREVAAHLVVDCTGRAQAGLKWLKRIPSMEGLDGLRLEYDARSKYRTFRFFIPPEARARLPIPGGYANVGWIFTFMPRPGFEQKFVVCDRLEGHRIELGFGGWGDPPRPDTPDDFEDYFATLKTDQPLPSWFMALVDELIKYKDTATIETPQSPPLSWVRYEQCPAIPSNFVAIGDAAMVVNPTFGQGCTKACIGAVALDGMLRSSSAGSSSIPDGFSRRFFKRHSGIIAGAWDGTKPADYQWDTTIPVKGENLVDEGFAGELGNLLMQLARNDKEVDAALFHIRCFLAPPTDFFRPSILLKIIVFWSKQKLNLA